MTQTHAPPSGRQPASRGNPGLGDIVRSVLLLALALLAVVWAGGLFRHDTVVQPRTVDSEAVARQAVSGPDGTASYPLLVPSTLPEGWRATQAGWDPKDGHWHIGLLTADDAYVGVEQQSAVTIDELVDRFASGATPAGDVEVGGTRWRVYVGAGGDRTAIVTRFAGVSTMVLGSPSTAMLASFARSLEPVRAG